MPYLSEIPVLWARKLLRTSEPLRCRVSAGRNSDRVTAATRVSPGVTLISTFPNVSPSITLFKDGFDLEPLYGIEP
jgi:hypothetical protein